MNADCASVERRGTGRPAGEGNAAAAGGEAVATGVSADGEMIGSAAVNAGGKSADEVRRMFAAIAGRYDLANALLSFGLDSSWRRRAAMEAADLPPLAIVDVCAGTGALSFDIARFAASDADAHDRAASESAETAVGPTGRGCLEPKYPPMVIGADFCQDMLRLACRRAAETAGGKAAGAVSIGARAKVGFVLADAMRLPFADGSAAAAFVAFGLRNVPDAERCLREMTRIVVPGGKVVVLEFYLPKGSFLGAVYSFYLRAVLPFAGRLISGAETDAYRYLARSVANFYGPDEISAMMEGAGLKEISAEPLTGGVVWLYRGRKR